MEWHGRKVFYVNGYSNPKVGLFFRCPVLATRFEMACHHWKDNVGAMPAWVERAEVVDPRLKLRKSVYVRPKWFDKVELEKYTPREPAAVTAKQHAKTEKVRQQKLTWASYQKMQAERKQKLAEVRAEAQSVDRVS